MAVAVAVAVVGTSVVTAGPAAAQTASATDIIRFFTGRTEGSGQLKIVMRAEVTVRVHGTGRIERDGTLALDQVVAEGDKRPRTRCWRIRQVASGRYMGTLSDAKGPVALDQIGARLRISYAGVDGNAYRQWLDFAPDGRSARNLLEVRRFGIRMAVLHETIRKPD